MNNYESHAWKEFRAAGWVDENNEFRDEMQKMICEHVLKLLDVFNGEGHSGTSAPYAICLFEKLANFKPVTPLTGKDSEWENVSELMGKPLYQNKRASNVFKDGEEAYDIDGLVFWEWALYEDEPFKSYWTSKDSRVPVTFPYTPEIKYVFVPNEEFPSEVL